MAQTSRSHAFDVFLLTALALVLLVTNSRITFIDDEVTIISAAVAPLHQTLEAFRSGAGLHEHPPLYDILLHFWLYLTGGSFVALRIPSIAFYLLGLWLLSRAAEELGSRPSARALLWLGALWPFGFHFGRLAAWYSFCFLIVAALTLAYLRLLRSPSPARWMLAMLCAAALVYTNYFGWAILACLAFDYVWSRREGRARATWLMIACGFLLALAYAAALARVPRRTAHGYALYPYTRGNLTSRRLYAVQRVCQRVGRAMELGARNPGLPLCRLSFFSWR